jgi:LytTr DNA-binding domain
MASDRKVTNPLKLGTNSGAGVTVALACVWVFVNAGINSVSVTTDLARRGVRVDAAEPWIWEFSSALGLLIWLWPVLVLDDALRARVRSGWARLALYAGASVVFSVAHVATMVALRQFVYRLAGWHYDFGSWADGLLYEYRKDVLSFAAIVVIAAVLRRLARREPVVTAAAADIAPTASASASASASVAPTFMVRTATHGDLLVRADEVDWVEAQGNYVALHVGDEVRLLRHTLAEMETRLKDHGFIRTHRRALVNRLRMQAIIPPELGELGVRLSSGQVVPLSESRRSEVVRLVLGA